MTYKCKICGGQTTVDNQSGIAICEYCGTKQALPLFAEDSERLLYDRGNNYLLHSEYDKAENVFNQLLTIKPGAAELYWDLVLCKYGVTYVKDPKTGKYIPTCNRTHYTPIFSDENYKKAIELSSGEKKALFEEDAKTIDNIQKGIIAVSKKEKPFDIFISYKETDANGNRTKDSIEAQKLYEKLTEAGYKVFFSRITLEDKIGTEYEPYIYAALYSSKVMLTICSSKENIEAVWVKNEWSRFLGFRQNDSSKTLLPLYFDMDKAELPEEFALLSAYDMKVDGFEEELLRGIKKLIPLPIMKAKRRKQILKATGIVAASLVVVAGIAAAIIIPKELEERRIAEEEAARASEAAALEKANEDAYQAAMTLFDNADYTAAEAAFIALGDYKDSAHMAARCPIQPDYDAAMQLYYNGKYAQASWAFESLGDYEDAPEQTEKAEISWRKSLAAIVSDNRYRWFGQNYYIDANGAVSACANNQEVEDLKSQKQAISVSFDPAMNVVALYEDGTISDESHVDWQDIIQIVPACSVLDTVALKADGTMVFSASYEDEYTKKAENVISQWKDIVMLSGHSETPPEDHSTFALAGVDAKGDVFLYHAVDEAVFGPVKSFMSKEEEFKNVKTIDISVTEYSCINAVALTYDGKLLKYINGNLSCRDAENVVDVALVGEDIYTLTSDGKLYKEGSNQAKMNDVINLVDTHTQSGFVAVLRSGTLVDWSGCKTYVHDEWLSKME